MGNTRESNEGNKPLKFIRNGNRLSGILFGLGLIAFVDETIFHQLLHWHHFYDKSTTSAGLVSDGFFHALSWFATVGGLFMVADLRRESKWNPIYWTGSVFLGAGAFQLYDGLIQHKLLRLHEIRYNVNILPYDLVWNSLAVFLIIVGFLMIRSVQQKSNKEQKDPRGYAHS